VPLKLRLYVAGVGLAAAILLLLYPLPDLRGHWMDYLIWVGICIASESLWFTPASGAGTITMASTAGLATAALFGQAGSMWIVALSTVIAEVVVLRKPAVRAFFNASQITLTMWAAGGVFTLLGGHVGTHASRPSNLFEALGLMAPFLGLFVSYLIVNRALIAVAISWSTGRAYLRVLREDWFYLERLMEDAAAFLLSPLMVVSYSATGYLGVVMFYVPLRIINESAKRSLELQTAHRQVIHSERMAAKGEMAAGVGHELNNLLAAIKARAQMLIKDLERGSHDALSRHASVILEQSDRMERLAQGLRDFSRAELRVERVDMNQLIQKSTELIKTQERFDGVAWDLQLTDPSPELRADPGQLQQVLFNLFINAADAMKSSNTPRRTITIRTAHEQRSGSLRLEVEDTGPGIPAVMLPRIFEPRFTTKTEGHGFGLSTSYRIVTNHGGRIAAANANGRGALFTVTLPLRGPAGWS
jgi:signal transduction histidine kinase